MSRIYQYPVVTEISSDDYLALGSATNGSRAILASDLAPVIGNKTITERGIYEASDDNMDGYGQVTVDIPYTDIHVASGDIATFEGEDLPLKSLKVSVTPYQDLSHGDPSPENICPIIGWDEAVVSVSGINVWDEEWESGQYNGNLSTGIITKSADATRIRSKNDILVVPNTTYYLASTQPLFAYFLDADKNWINRVGSNGTTLAKNAAFTTPDNCYFIKFFTINTATYNNDISINYPSTATTYSPYNGATYTIDLNGTRYGGVLDATNGTMTVDRAIKTLSASDSFSISNDGNRSRITWDDYAYIGKTAGYFIANRLTPKEPTTGGYGSNIWEVFGSSVAPRCWITAPISIATVSDFTTWLANNPVQLVYELATPITVQLAPQPVKSIEGTNNISANCGAVDVEYQTVWVRPTN